MTDLYLPLQRLEGGPRLAMWKVRSWKPAQKWGQAGRQTRQIEVAAVVNLKGGIGSQQVGCNLTLGMK